MDIIPFSIVVSQPSSHHGPPGYLQMASIGFLSLSDSDKFLDSNSGPPWPAGFAEVAMVVPANPGLWLMVLRFAFLHCAGYAEEIRTSK